MALPASDGPVLEVQDLEVAYRGTPVVRRLTLQVPGNCLTALVGPNGAGKTTLLRTAAGLVQPSHGRILLRGEPVTGLPVWEMVARGLVYVPEGMEVFPDMSVAENLEVGAYVARKGLAARLEEIFRLFPELAGRRRQPAGVLSGGQQRMVTLARGLMSGARILLFDEPFLGLSPRFVKLFLEIFLNLRSQGLTLVVASQLETPLLLPEAETAYFLENGRVLRAGPGSRLLNDPELRDFFLSAPA
jgi:branched-chain amino acid transport system ATP-binding protein